MQNVSNYIASKTSKASKTGLISKNFLIFRDFKYFIPYPMAYLQIVHGLRDLKEAFADVLWNRIDSDIKNSGFYMLSKPDFIDLLGKYQK